MTDPHATAVPMSRADEAISLLALGAVVLRRRRSIVLLGAVGAFLGLMTSLISSRVYTSSATFIPQSSEGANVSGLAVAASQFGLRLPPSSGAWGPPVFVELLHSQAVLEPIALDTFTVAEEGGRRASLISLLEIKGPTAARRLDLAIRALRGLVAASEVKALGAVRLSVSTRWPSVSLALGQRLVQGVNEFNLEKRKSQAVAERVFVEAQASEAERALRNAEDKLQLFLQRNRSIASSPELQFENDRLQREITLRQQAYTSLLQSREEARIREVRNTPVITVLEDPRLPVVADSRHAFQKGVLDGLAGLVLGLVIAVVAEVVGSARRLPSQEAQDFFRLLDQATPRFLRRGRSS